MNPIRLVFMGTAELACPVLKTLAESPEFQVAGVVTQPDRPKGRDLQLTPPPVKSTALQLGLRVLQPERVRHESVLSALAAWQPAMIIVAAYGQILPQAILDLPPFGCLNVHASLLPRHRGASPIQWAIMEGDAETGITIMQMDAGLDTGPILSQSQTPISPDDTAQSLHDRLAAIGAQLLIQTIPRFVTGQVQPRPQPTQGVSYARKIAKEDGQLDWRQPALALRNRLRAFTPWPGSFSYLPGTPKPLLIKIWVAEVVPGGSPPPGTILAVDADTITVACGQDALRVRELQREGKRRMTTREFLAGHPLQPGDHFL